ncbi:hypothetical protein C5167_031294 [Papaver somniferum]|nr:hypothetical protein C5167_031294 [Papaver somniferum]
MIYFRIMGSIHCILPRHTDEVCHESSICEDGAEQAPSVIFMNDVDNIGSACMESGTGNGYNEVQKTKGVTLTTVILHKLFLLVPEGRQKTASSDPSHILAEEFGGTSIFSKQNLG